MSAFDKLWAGQTVSLLGSAFTVFALPTLAVLVLHATPLEIGVLSALQGAPFAIMGMLIGVLADRTSRRRIMILANAVRFAALATVPLAAAFGGLRLPQLYAVALVTGCASAFFGIAYQSYLPVIVSAERLTDANVKLEVSNSGSSMLGSALAGLLVRWLGAAETVGVGALAYVLSIVSLARIRVAEPARDRPPLTLHLGVREMREGIRVVFDSHDLRWLVFATGSVNFGGAMVNAIVPIYLYERLHLRPEVVGIIYGLAGVGFVGAFLSKQIRERIGLRLTLIVALAVYGGGTAFMLLARVGAPYVVLSISEVAVAIAMPVFNVNQVSYRQALVAADMQGRASATIRTFVAGAVPLGSITGGYLGSVFGVPTILLLGALVGAASGLWLLPLRERSPPLPAVGQGGSRPA